MFTIPKAFVNRSRTPMARHKSFRRGLPGLIMLAGIVVNNAIVLVDYTNTLRDRGLASRRRL